MDSVSNRGIICVKNKSNIEFAICKIDYSIYEDGTFKYEFTPYYDVINLLDANVFQGIPGLNLDLKKEKYVRENVIPTFISERVPSENREDYFDLLQEVGLDYMDPIEYLIKVKKQYSGDKLYLKPFVDRQEIAIENIVSKNNSHGAIKIILDNIANGNKVLINNELIENEKNVFNTLMYIYQKGLETKKEEQKIGIESARENKKYKGRKSITIDILDFLENVDMFERRKITLDEILSKFNISRATFFRLKNKYQNFNDTQLIH